MTVSVAAVGVAATTSAPAAEAPLVAGCVLRPLECVRQPGDGLADRLAAGLSRSMMVVMPVSVQPGPFSAADPTLRVPAYVASASPVQRTAASEVRGGPVAGDVGRLRQARPHPQRGRPHYRPRSVDVHPLQRPHLPHSVHVHHLLPQHRRPPTYWDSGFSSPLPGAGDPGYRRRRPAWNVVSRRQPTAPGRHYPRAPSPRRSGVQGDEMGLSAAPWP